ncbi:hypothetical protein OG21DRAFT_1525288 [Imleria badia]|nr:hypothetical protein OG21DRAFT_1525288 [Imleria badia]
MSTLVPSLNALLAALSLPFSLDHPTDLTPSLLLAIFESLINARLPIPSSVRQSRTRDAKARAMLVLLGVLECDVLRGGTSSDAEHSIAASTADDSVLGGAGGVSVDGWVDEIGLGEVDPERLADGGWEETIFVGELLCWLARRKGILPRTRSSHRSSRSLYSNHHSYGTEEGDTTNFSSSLLLQPSPKTSRSPRPPSPSPSIVDVDADADFSALSHISDVPRHPLVHSPEPSLSVSATTGTDLSIRARSVSSRTSVSIIHDDPDEFEEASQDTVQMYDPRQMMQDTEEDDDRPPTFRARCIHDLEDPSYIRALGGPSSSFDPSVSHERVFEDEDDPSRDEDDVDAQDNDPYAPPTPTPRRVRLTGWIDAVDAATELGHFATSRSLSRSRAFNTSAGSGSGPPSQPQSHSHTHTGELSNHISPRPRPGSSKPRTPRRPSPSPSPPPTSSTHQPLRSPPSPPSPPAHSDPPFDVSFSTLNNTSTPAKPRPPRRPQTTTRSEKETASRRRERSPSYTPSPPSFTTPGSLRSGSGATGSSGTKPRLGAPALPPSTRKGTSPPLVASPGSTATTSTLLTERARLLTELAALKRARAASGSGALSSVGGGSGSGSGSGGGHAVVGRRVGVGIRS